MLFYVNSSKQCPNVTCTRSFASCVIHVPFLRFKLSYIMMFNHICKILILIKPTLNKETRPRQTIQDRSSQRAVCLQGQTQLAGQLILAPLSASHCDLLLGSFKAAGDYGSYLHNLNDYQFYNSDHRNNFMSYSHFYKYGINIYEN